MNNIEALEKRFWSSADNLRANSPYASEFLKASYTKTHKFLLILFTTLYKVLIKI